MAIFQSNYVYVAFVRMFIYLGVCLNFSFGNICCSVGLHLCLLAAHSFMQSDENESLAFQLQFPSSPTMLILCRMRT